MGRSLQCCAIDIGYELHCSRNHLLQNSPNKFPSPKVDFWLIFVPRNCRLNHDIVICSTDMPIVIAAIFAIILFSRYSLGHGPRENTQNRLLDVSPPCQWTVHHLACFQFLDSSLPPWTIHLQVYLILNIRMERVWSPNQDKQPMSRMTLKGGTSSVTLTAKLTLKNHSICTY